MTLNIVSPPPISWFRNPNLTELTPLTVTPEGQVFGHIAAWGQNHLSFPGRAVRAPRSSSDYRWFHTGSVDVIGDNGDLVTVSVGKISQGGGHAELSLTASETARYYDDATSIVAVICAFDQDPNGIAFSGAILEGTDEVSIRRLKACGGVSGDWRAVTPGSGLEMVACLAVPTGGFAIPRSRVASGAPLALVAAGIVPPPASFGRRVDPAWESGERVAELAVDNVTIADAAINSLSLGRITIGDAGEIRMYPSTTTAYAAAHPTPSPADMADLIAARLDERRKAGELSAAHAALVAELDDTPAVVASLLAEVDDTPDAVAALLADLGGDADPKFGLL